MLAVQNYSLASHWIDFTDYSSCIPVKKNTILLDRAPRRFNVLFSPAPPQEGREQYELAATSEQGGKKSKPKGKKEKDKDMDELKKEVDLVSLFSDSKHLLAKLLQ